LGENQTPILYNDPDLVARAVVSMQTMLGKENLESVAPMTVSEDFGRYGKTEEKIPVSIFWLGVVNREAYEKSIREGTILPMLHNPEFYPDFSLSYQTGVSAMTITCLDVFKTRHP